MIVLLNFLFICHIRIPIPDIKESLKTEKLDKQDRGLTELGKGYGLE
jgi:hypothetical protein